MGETLRFKNINRESMKEVWPYLQQENGRSCDFSYGGVLMWVDYFKYEYAICRETLFIKGVVEDNRTKTAFSVPVGALQIEDSFKILNDYCKATGEELIFSAVPEYLLSELNELNPKNITELTDWGDYLYTAESLAYLQGRKMAKKRNHVNKHFSTYSDSCYERLGCDNLADVKRFMNDFELSENSSAMAFMERDLAVKLLDEICNEENPLTGGLVRVGGKIVAYTIGDIKRNTLFVHVEKANREITGAYEVINKLFAEDIVKHHPEVKFINREDDSGDEGLRKAKLSYNPVEIIKKYNVIF